MISGGIKARFGDDLLNYTHSITELKKLTPNVKIEGSESMQKV